MESFDAYPMTRWTTVKMTELTMERMMIDLKQDGSSMEGSMEGLMIGLIC
jgi:hypothetical protein